MNSHYVMHYTISSLYTVKKDYLSIKCTMFHFTRISLYTIYLEKPKSCKVRATCSKNRGGKSYISKSVNLYLYSSSIRELEIESHKTRLKSSSKGDDARRQGSI